VKNLTLVSDHDFMEEVNFLLKHRYEIHKSMNYVWKVADRLRREFAKEHLTSLITPTFNNYIRINERWDKQEYPVPVFKIDVGEVIVNLDSASTVIGVYSKSLTENFLKELIELKGTNIEIYGGQNFFNTFYEKGMKVCSRALLKRIIQSSEGTIQVEVRRPLTECLKLLDDVRKVLTLIRKHKIEIVKALD